MTSYLVIKKHFSFVVNVVLIVVRKLQSVFSALIYYIILKS